MTNRAASAFEDVVAIERLAPSVVRVVTFSDSYTVDPDLEACRCPDFQYNLDGDGRCKHILAAQDAEGMLGVGHHTIETDLSRRERPLTDGGTGWMVRDPSNDNSRSFDSRAAAEEAVEEMAGLGIDVELVPPHGGNGEGGDETPVATDAPGPDTHVPERSVAQDPLEFLPSYMIDHVQGTPTLNKRGLSVLAFEYGVTITDREILQSPHDTDWESASVVTTVQNREGNTFVGAGTAHVDRGDGDEREILLELAETRSYKRAVSLATGTGIVAYQELVGELEDG